MVARTQEAVHPVDPTTKRVAERREVNAVAPSSVSATPGRVESMIRRATAIGALGWLGYVGYLLRDCPRSGAICQTSNFAISAAVMALGIVLLGHLAGLAASSVERRLHSHHALH